MGIRGVVGGAPRSFVGASAADRTAPRRTTARLDRPRLPRLVARPNARASVDGTALHQPGAGRRQRHPLLSRLLHRRFSLAQRARVRARAVHAATSQPVSRAARDELLLDVLPASIEYSEADGIADARCRHGAKHPQGERDARGATDGGVAVPRRPRRSTTARRSGDCGDARRRGRERRRLVRHHRSHLQWPAALGAARYEHRCHHRVVLRWHAHRQRAAIALVHTAAHDCCRTRTHRLVDCARQRCARVTVCDPCRRTRTGTRDHDESIPGRVLRPRLRRDDGRRRAVRRRRLAADRASRACRRASRLPPSRGPSCAA